MPSSSPPDCVSPVIKLASGFEHGTRHRHAPRFLPTLGVKEFLPRDTNTRKGGAADAGKARQRPGSDPAKGRWKVTGL